MKAITEFPLFSLLPFLASAALNAQEITFDQGNWQTDNVVHQKRLVTVMANEERLDTMYTEDLSTGEMQIVIQEHPLARYEYFPSNEPFPALWRRIDIRQQEIVDTTFVEEIATGELVMMVQKFIKDIPNGAYNEFFLNGNIRIKGTLDGYTPEGNLKKTGTWMEWDEDGKVIRTETHP